MEATIDSKSQKNSKKNNRSTTQPNKKHTATTGGWKTNKNLESP